MFVDFFMGGLVAGVVVVAFDLWFGWVLAGFWVYLDFLFFCRLIGIRL